jgi:CxxC motif-containing protein (DUF1111 family)
VANFSATVRTALSRTSELRAIPLLRSVVAVAAVGWLASAFLVAQRSPLPGGPLAGLTPVEFEEFRLGLDDFVEVEAPEEGLGPAFNGTSCAGCHSVPAIGGISLISEFRAGRLDSRGQFVTLDATGETLFHLFSVPNHGCQPIMPTDATVIARRVPLPLFGAGLVEAIADETLLAIEDPFDRDRDGISGRAARIVDVASGTPRVGRFGWKSQHATLLAFSADAYRNEMGITNDLFPGEVAFGVTADRMRVCDPIPDPEDIMDPRTRRRGIDNFASFMRLLAPVPRDSAAQENGGAQVFAAIGCGQCHTPSLRTAPHANPLFDRREVALFSDLLLHDVATGDGIVQGDATAREIRTPALWGLRLRRPLLHDGSASTIDEAIGRHGAEAELSRRGFERLTDADRAALSAFLRSL